MVIAVTGATGLIGAEICRTFAKDHQVVGIYRTRADRADLLMREISRTGGHFKPICCDLLQPGAPPHAYEEVKSIAASPLVVILAAGSKQRKLAMLAQPELVYSLFDLNVFAQIEFARLALKDMIKARFGRIILVGSRAGQVGLPGQAAYAASKAALSAWAASLAGEVGNYGITVNVVAPGAMQDEGDGFYSESEQRVIVERIGCRRLGTPQDVAAAVIFLASADAAYINGITLPVDGGARF